MLINVGNVLIICVIYSACNTSSSRCSPRRVRKRKHTKRYPKAFDLQKICNTYNMGAWRGPNARPLFDLAKHLPVLTKCYTRLFTSARLFQEERQLKKATKKSSTLWVYALCGFSLWRSTLAQWILNLESNKLKTRMPWMIATKTTIWSLVVYTIGVYSVFRTPGVCTVGEWDILYLFCVDIIFYWKSVQC